MSIKHRPLLSFPFIKHNLIPVSIHPNVADFAPVRYALTVNPRADSSPINDAFKLLSIVVCHVSKHTPTSRLTADKKFSWGRLVHL